MQNNQNVDLGNLPKQFCENVTGHFNKEFFLVVLMNGTAASPFVFTPQHAKKFHQWLGNKIGEYEKQYSEIDAKWEPGIQSPIQVNDLNNDNK